MATIYYWLEDYDNAIRCSEGLIANDFDKGDGKDLKIAAERLRAKMANSKIKTRHYVRDVSNAVAPEMTEVQKEEEVARQNALKDKAMREAADREVTSQRQSSGMVDLDKSINAIGGLLGGAKFREKQKQREDIRELTESISSLNNLLEGKSNDKLEALSKAIELDSSSKNNYVARAKFFWRELKYDAAVRDFTKALNIDPKDADILTSRGFVFVNGLEQFDNAIKDFSKVIALAPKEINAYNSRAYTYWRMQNYQKSLEDYQKVVELEPKNLSAYQMLASTYDNMKNFEMSASTYTELIKIKPTAQYYNNRGWALSNVGKFKEAMPDFDKAISLEPKDGIYYKNRGNAKNKLGQYSSALEDLQIAVEKKIDLHHKSLSNKGDSYLGLEKYNQALQNYEEALKIKPDFQEAIDGKEKAEAKLKK